MELSLLANFAVVCDIPTLVQAVKANVLDITEQLPWHKLYKDNYIAFPFFIALMH